MPEELSTGDKWIYQEVMAYIRAIQCSASIRVMPDAG